MKTTLTLLFLLSACTASLAQPSNNNFANATEITNTSGWSSSDAAYTTVSATNDGVAGSCSLLYKNVWFKFKATTNEIEIKVTTGGTKGTLLYPTVTLYNAAGKAISCNATVTAIAVAFIQTTSLTRGNWYYLSVDSFNNPTYPGSFTLTLTDQIGFDLREKAVRLLSDNWSSSDAAYSNTNATADGATGTCSNIYRNVWFSFQPTTSSPEIKLTTGGSKGSMSYPILTLYNSGGTAIQCIYPGIQSGIVSLKASGLTIGDQYYFTVDNAANASYPGTFTIEVNNGFGNVMNAYGFMYKYDSRQRVAQKKVPGAEWIYMVYDDRDRLVMTQDGNQRATANKYWSFTKYDQFNRQIMTGVWSTMTSHTQESMQAVVDAYYSSGNPAQLYETFIGSATGNVHGYSNYSFPNNTSSAGETDPFKYLSVTYYDNYSFTTLIPRDYSYVPEGLSETVNGVTYTQRSNAFAVVNGQVTGHKTKVLDGGVTGGYTWLNTVNYYDNKYRVIQVLADNYKGGTDMISNVLDFAGRILKTKLTHFTNNVTWTDLANVQQLGNKLIGFPPAAWNAGAVSREVLPAGVNGWMEFTVSESTRKIVGLNDSNSGGTSPTDIDYAFQLNNGGLTVQQGSTVVASLGGIAPGDVLRIERYGTTITFKRNGKAIPYNPGATRIASTSSLMVDNAFYLQGSTLAGVRASFSQRTREITRRFTYDHAGRLLTIKHRIGNSPEVMLLQNEYNELGQLIDKKLHSISGSRYKQSVDYRYNIRGWLTSINNSQLNANKFNDDVNDLFGLELGYERSIGTSNTLLYNGNIGAIKWSKNMALNPNSRDIAYNYCYDTLNRLKGAQFKENLSGVWVNANSFTESNYKYDLNGNILSLVRNDSSGATMDDLTFNYGLPGSRSNRLLNVTDAADDNAGFKEVDSSNKLDDYSYDANGNLLWDRNKGGVELLRNGNFVNGSSNWALTDPGGRMSFGTTGRVVFVSGTANATITQSGVIRPNAPHVVTIQITRTSGTGNVTISVGGVGTVVNSGSVTMSVTAGSGADLAMTASPGFVGYISNVSIRGLTVITYNVLNLPEQVSNAGNSMMQYIYEAGGAKLAQIVYGGGAQLMKTTDYVGECTYQNDTLRFINTEEGRVMLSGSSPEYQYHLKDHLGNVRLTFTSKNDIASDRATVERDSLPHERSKFLNIDKARRINAKIFDHTYNGIAPINGAYSTRLTGSPNEKIGLASSLSVMPGDRIEVEVFAKYVDAGVTNDNVVVNILSAIASGGSVPAGTYVDGSGYASTGTISYPFTGFFVPTSNGVAPKAYLNYVVFDRGFNLKDYGFKQISTAARETGDVNGHSGLTYEGMPHERLAFENAGAIQIREPGYVYIWLSNEETTPVEVFFDDLKITHSKSPVIQQQDYYPFGLRFNSYSREKSVPNKRNLFQGQEHIDDLGLNWDSFKWRNHMPDIGRFFNVDPLAEKYGYNSPYAFAENRVIDGNELEGLEWVRANSSWHYDSSNPEGSRPVASWGSTDQCGTQQLNIGGPSGTVQTFTANTHGMVELPHSGQERTGAGSQGTFSIDGRTVYGYHNRNDIVGGSEDQWGTPQGISNMINAIVEYNQCEPDLVSIGDMKSPENGTVPNRSPTNTHHADPNAFDIRLLTTDGAGGGDVSNANFSTPKTQSFINALGNNGFTRFLIGPAAAPNLRSSGTISVVDGGGSHDNHYHVDTTPANN